jgi:hypothetical protein
MERDGKSAYRHVFKQAVNPTTTYQHGLTLWGSEIEWEKHGKAASHLNCAKRRKCARHSACANCVWPVPDQVSDMLKGHERTVWNGKDPIGIRFSLRISTEISGCLNKAPKHWVTQYAPKKGWWALITQSGGQGSSRPGATRARSNVREIPSRMLDYSRLHQGQREF